MIDGDTPRRLSDLELDELEVRIDQWAQAQHELPVVAAVERGEPGDRRWFIRINGERKDVYTLWLWLRQRTLQFETYLLPSPEENITEVFDYLLRANHQLVGVSFTIGEEDAIFLRGHVPSSEVNEAELDRILGTVYQLTEHHFMPLLQRAFASRLAATTGVSSPPQSE